MTMTQISLRDLAQFIQGKRKVHEDILDFCCWDTSCVHINAMGTSFVYTLPSSLAAQLCVPDWLVFLLAILKI